MRDWGGKLGKAGEEVLIIATRCSWRGSALHSDNHTQRWRETQNRDTQIAFGYSRSSGIASCVLAVSDPGCFRMADGKAVIHWTNKTDRWVILHRRTSPVDFKVVDIR